MIGLNTSYSHCPKCGQQTIGGQFLCGHTPPSAAPEGAPREGIPRYMQCSFPVTGVSPHPQGNFIQYSDHESALRALTEERDRLQDRVDKLDAYAQATQDKFVAVREERDRALREEFSAGLEAAALMILNGSAYSAHADVAETHAKWIRSLAKHPAPATPRKDGQ